MLRYFTLSTAFSQNHLPPNYSRPASLNHTNLSIAESHSSSDENHPTGISPCPSKVIQSPFPYLNQIAVIEFLNLSAYIRRSYSDIYICA
jgi:hypothetical protein